MRVNFSSEIKLKRILIILFSFFIVTEFIYVSIFNSITLEIVVMSFFIFVLALHAIIVKSPIYIQRIDFFYVLAILMVFFSLRGLSENIVPYIKIAEVVTFVLIIVICYFLRGDIKSHLIIFEVIKIFGIYLSLSVLFSFLFPYYYEIIIDVVFRTEISSRIIESMRSGYYTGFTSEVSITAGLIILAIGYIYVQNTIRNEKYTPKDIIILIILILGLLLTQKRAHLLFTLLTVLIVHVHYLHLQKYFFQKFLKSIGYLLGTVGLLFVILEVIGLREKIFLRFKITLDALLAGQDISSNRIVLYDHAIHLFSQSPLLGIGWGNFMETLIGDVTVHTKMQTHNIYLQLLAETGIIGLIVILFPFILTLIYTLKISKKIFLNTEKITIDWRIGILFSFYIQIFFLLYGFTGNPLYDNVYLFPYFIASSIIFSYIIYEKQNKIEQKSKITKKKMMY